MKKKWVPYVDKEHRWGRTTYFFGVEVRQFIGKFRLPGAMMVRPHMTPAQTYKEALDLAQKEADRRNQEDGWS